MTVKENVPYHVQNAIDAGAGLVVLGAIAKILPPVAAFLSIVWLLIRIWESDTVREWTHRMKGEKHGDKSEPR